MKKLRALFFGLNTNRIHFLQALCITIAYNLITSMFDQSGVIVGFLFNLLLFAFLGAAVRPGNSLFCNLAMTRKEKVKEVYQSFAFIISLIVLWKIVSGLIWNLILMRFSGEGFQGFFSFNEPEVKKYYILQAYTFFTTMGFEFLLFPILFITRTKNKIMYFIKAALVSVLPTWMFCFFGILLSGSQNKSWYSFLYLADAFMEFPQKVLLCALLYAAIFMAVSIWAANKIAWKQFEKEMGQRIYQIEKKAGKGRKKRWLLIAAAATGILCVTGVSALLFSEAKQLEKIRSLEVAGTQLTKDTVFGPMVMSGEVYLPSTYVPELKNEEERGLFLYKGENQKDLLYGLLFANYAYTDQTDENKTYCRVRGSDLHSYVRADHMEKMFDLENYKKAVILDPDFLDKQAGQVRNSRVGIHDLDLNVLNDLENMFGEVTYKTDDFDQIDSYYPVLGTREAYGNEEWMSEAEFYLNNSEVIGCILVRDGNYYYGNLNNPIPREVIPLPFL
jgi:hypothetical protein